jgi:hypothetical protein
MTKHATTYITTKRASYSVSLTGREHDTLEPITFRLTSGAAGVQDYLTPAHARVLADQLVAAAVAAEEGS